MDLLLVSQSIVILTLALTEIQAEKDPISKYSEYLNIKDVKEDMKRRRKQVRIQPISLKPPPQDWPEPVMAPGDFIFTSQSEATSLSPLLAYQAKLEQEYERQKKEKLQQEMDKEKTDGTKVASQYTSSEEDLHKLLDPDELIKHNKQLRPFGGQVLAARKQGKEARPAGISSLTALKAKTPKKTKRKAKSVSLITTTSRPRRGRKKITVQKVDSEDNSSSEELKRKKARSNQSYIEPTQAKQHRKKHVRKFTFAEQKYEDSGKPLLRRKNKPANAEESKQKSVTTSSPTESTQPTQKIVTTPRSTERTQQSWTMMTSISAEVTEQSWKTVSTSSPTTESIPPSPKTVINLSTDKSIKPSEETVTASCSSESSESSIENEIHKDMDTKSKTTDAEMQEYEETTTEIFSKTTITSKLGTDIGYSTTSLPIDLSSKSLEDISSFSTTSEVDSAVLEVTTKPLGTTEVINLDMTKNEIRKKRKEMKQEMEKVLEAEELEGSFADSDSDWTTSEEEFYVEYNEMEKAFKKKIEALKQTRTTQKPMNATTFKNIYKNIIQLLN